jgi:hypothetical protein
LSFDIENPRYKNFLEKYNDPESDTVCFIGAGLSSPLFPSWKSLLIEMLELCSAHGSLKYDKSELLKKIENGESYLDIAEVCSKAMGENGYRDFLEKKFDINVNDSNIPVAYKELLSLSIKTLITTNYDRIPDVGSKGSYRVFTNKNISEALRAIESKKSTLVKVHGNITDHESIVFTQEDYERIINKKPDVSSFLKSIFSTKRVLFVGFGLTDPHFDLILSSLKVINNNIGITHYALLSISSEFEREMLENKYGIKIIPYDSVNSHQQVREFLRSLGKNEGEPISGNSPIRDSAELSQCVGQALRLKTGHSSFLVNFDESKKILNISLIMISTTEIEIRRELITILKNLNINTDVISRVKITLLNRADRTPEINAFSSIVISCSFEYDDLQMFINKKNNLESFWRKLHFSTIENIGTIRKEEREVSFPYSEMSL